MDDILILHAARMINNRKRVNKFKIKKREDGSIIVRIMNGHNEETGYKREASIMFDDNHIAALRAWLNTVP